MRWLALGFAAVPFVSTLALAESMSPGNGWQQVFLDDFKGMIFAGVSKHKYCVEQAYVKAGEIREKGGSYIRVLALEDAVQLAATTQDGKEVFILCSPNGALAMYFKAPASLTTVYEAAQQLGSEQRLGDPQVIQTRTSIDLQTGKATSTTTMPQQ